MTSARNAILPAALVAMSATAWMALSRPGQSPWAPAGHVHGLDDAAGLFIGGWVLMTVAMMLPTTMPLLLIFRRLTSARSNGTLLTLLVVAGYLSAWTLFGMAVFVANTALQGLIAGTAWLTAYPRVPAAALFVVAGAFQFSDVKYRCLDKCRSPLSFVTSRWRGTHEVWQSFRLGAEHGAFCVGCCWALMLLMFASAVTGLVWMLVLAGIMAVEKNAPWGRRASRPIGVALLMAAPLMLLVG